MEIHMSLQGACQSIYEIGVAVGRDERREKVTGRWRRFGRIDSARPHFPPKPAVNCAVKDPHTLNRLETAKGPALACRALRHADRLRDREEFVAELLPSLVRKVCSLTSVAIPDRVSIIQQQSDGRPRLYRCRDLYDAFKAT